MLAQKTEQIQEFEQNTEARVEVVFCSDPQPRDVHWEWGQDLRIEEGKLKERAAQGEGFNSNLDIFRGDQGQVHRSPN